MVSSWRHSRARLGLEQELRRSGAGRSSADDLGRENQLHTHETRPSHRSHQSLDESRREERHDKRAKREGRSGDQAHQRTHRWGFMVTIQQHHHLSSRFVSVPFFLISFVISDFFSFLGGLAVSGNVNSSLDPLFQVLIFLLSCSFFTLFALYIVGGQNEIGRRNQEECCDGEGGRTEREPEGGRDGEDGH